MLRQNRIDCLLFERTNGNLLCLRSDVRVVLKHLMADMPRECRMVCFADEPDSETFETLRVSALPECEDDKTNVWQGFAIRRAGASGPA